MYRHILIPTDGSELAHKAVTHGLSLAKSVGAKVTTLTVEPSFYAYDVLPSSQMDYMAEAFAGHAELIKAHAAAVLSRVAEAAKVLGVRCESVQIEHDRPYETIIAVA